MISESPTAGTISCNHSTTNGQESDNLSIESLLTLTPEISLSSSYSIEPRVKRPKFSNYEVSTIELEQNIQASMTFVKNNIDILRAVNCQRIYAQHERVHHHNDSEWNHEMCDELPPTDPLIVSIDINSVNMYMQHPKLVFKTYNNCQPISETIPKAWEIENHHFNLQKLILFLKFISIPYLQGQNFIPDDIICFLNSLQHTLRQCESEIKGPKTDQDVTNFINVMCFMIWRLMLQLSNVQFIYQNVFVKHSERRKWVTRKTGNKKTENFEVYTDWWDDTPDNQKSDPCIETQRTNQFAHPTLLFNPESFKQRVIYCLMVSFEVCADSSLDFKNISLEMQPYIEGIVAQRIHVKHGFMKQSKMLKGIVVDIFFQLILKKTVEDMSSSSFFARHVVINKLDVTPWTHPRPMRTNIWKFLEWITTHLRMERVAYDHPLYFNVFSIICNYQTKALVGDFKDDSMLISVLYNQLEQAVCNLESFLSRQMDYEREKTKEGIDVPLHKSHTEFEEILKMSFHYFEQLCAINSNVVDAKNWLKVWVICYIIAAKIVFDNPFFIAIKSINPKQSTNVYRHILGQSEKHNSSDFAKAEIFIFLTIKNCLMHKLC